MSESKKSKKLSGINKLLRQYGELMIGDDKFCWDYSTDQPIKSTDFTKEMRAESNKAFFHVNQIDS